MIASSRGDRRERQRPGRPAQPGQVLREPEDPAVVEPQALPDGVAALDDGVERAETCGLVAVAQHAVDVDEQVALRSSKVCSTRAA